MPLTFVNTCFSISHTSGSFNTVKTIAYPPKKRIAAISNVAKFPIPSVLTHPELATPITVANTTFP